MPLRVFVLQERRIEPSMREEKGHEEEKSRTVLIHAVISVRRVAVVLRMCESPGGHILSTQDNNIV